MLIYQIIVHGVNGGLFFSFFVAKVRNEFLFIGTNGTFRTNGESRR